MFTRAFDRRVRTFALVAVLSVTVGLAFGTFALWPANVERGYQPAQPVSFPHTVMAGRHAIACLYCHAHAPHAAHAGVPPVSLCMHCHQEIRPRDARGEVKASLQDLIGRWERGEAIRWAKVHDLADFVYFDHRRHLAPRTGLGCAACHGPVETMERVERVHSLKMGWCLGCHREPPPANARPGQDTRAPTHCSTCHR